MIGLAKIATHVVGVSHVELGPKEGMKSHIGSLEDVAYQRVKVLSPSSVHKEKDVHSNYTKRRICEDYRPINMKTKTYMSCLHSKRSLM